MQGLDAIWEISVKGRQDMNRSKIDAVAEALAGAYRNGGNVFGLAEELLPTNWQEAYQVQDALDERLGFELAGWKIGNTSRAGMQQFDMDHPPFLAANTVILPNTARRACGWPIFATSR